jgi:citronellyl-CoA dehydrogenase
MTYTDTHIDLMKSVTKFCETEINPFVAQWESAGIFPAHGLFKKMGQLGFLGIHKPEAFGGLGLDYSYQLAFAEALGASRSASVNLAIAVQTDMATPALARYGSDRLREQFLTPTIAGDYVCCLGVSEVGAGSDMANITTTARSDGDDYVIHGGKMWTTKGVQADCICLLCNTSDSAPLLNKSLICVPMKTAGVTVARKLEKLGMHASDTAQIFFDDVRVPQRFRIGLAGRGLLYQMESFLEERLFVAASALIAMERAIQETAAYTRERKTFGRPIIENQVVYFRLAELETKIEALRSLIYRAVDQYVAGTPATRLVCMAKLMAGRLLREVTDGCLQYFGAMGYMAETEISRMYRDGRLVSIGGGSDEMMLLMISRLMGLLPQDAG